MAYMADGGGGGSSDEPILRGDWPGLDSKKEQVTFDPKKMDEIADILQDELDKLTGGQRSGGSGGLFATLQQKRQINGSLGGSDHVQDAEYRIMSGSDAVANYTQNYIRQFQAAIDTLRRSAGTYQGAAENTQTSVTNVYGQNDTGDDPVYR